MTAPTYLYDQGCLVLALLQLSEHQHRQHAENCGKESRHIHDSSWNVPADQKPPWATSPKSRETSPVCSPKRLQKPSRNWPHQRKLMPTGAFQRGRLLVQITSRSLHRHSLTQSKARSYLHEDSFEMTAVSLGNSSFYTLATVQRWALLGHTVQLVLDMSGKRVKTEVIKTPVCARDALISHLQR